MENLKDAHDLIKKSVTMSPRNAIKAAEAAAIQESMVGVSIGSGENSTKV